MVMITIPIRTMIAIIGAIEIMKHDNNNKKNDIINSNSWFSHKSKRHKRQQTAAMLVSQTKETIEILLLRVQQHGRHDVK